MSSIEERFWAKVKKGKPEDCWLWLGYHGRTGGGGWGYGRFSFGGRRNLKVVLPHRFVYELLVGPIPDGLTIDHLCRVRHCVNPAHLEPVSQRINLIRGNGFAGQQVRREYCPRGHPYDDVNTYRTPAQPNQRKCKACCLERSRQQRLDGYQREYRRKNREKMNAYHREWRARNPGKAAEYTRRCKERKMLINA